jgi:hypothetical protein
MESIGRELEFYTGGFIAKSVHDSIWLERDR